MRQTVWDQMHNMIAMNHLLASAVTVHSGMYSRGASIYTLMSSTGDNYDICLLSVVAGNERGPGLTLGCLPGASDSLRQTGWRG